MSEIRVGEKAPDFDLPEDAGGRVSLSDLKGSIVALYFYPKDDTSGCTAEAIAFSALEEEFRAAGTVVVGVSKDSCASHAKFRRKFNLTVRLAADEAGEAVNAYGVWVEKSMYGRKYMGIERTTFLIGRDGRVTNVWPKVKVPGHAEAVLAAARALG